MMRDQSGLRMGKNRSFSAAQATISVLCGTVLVCLCGCVRNDDIGLRIGQKYFANNESGTRSNTERTPCSSASVEWVLLSPVKRAMKKNVGGLLIVTTESGSLYFFLSSDVYAAFQARKNDMAKISRMTTHKPQNAADPVRVDFSMNDGSECLSVIVMWDPSADEPRETV